MRFSTIEIVHHGYSAGMMLFELKYMVVILKYRHY